jgi:hypothetical protein
MQEVVTSLEPENIASIHSGLQKVFEVSAFLNYPFTLDEVANYFLPGLNVTGQQLGSLFARGNFVDIPFRIEDHYLLTHAAQSETLRLERQQFSAAKLRSAGELARVLTRMIPFIRTIAVTGSVAYRSAGKWDDIDLFVVTKRNRLWLSLFMAIILVRIWKLLRLRPSHLLSFCLSYVHDERGFAEDSLRNQANPLFARELLMAEPVVGEDRYRKLLERNDWVGEFYSNPYGSKLTQLGQSIESRDTVQSRYVGPFALALDLAEEITFTLLSRYLQVRAYLMNLRLRSQGLEFRIFEPKTTRASCVYTSNFYRWLHSIWGQR